MNRVIAFILLNISLLAICASAAFAGPAWVYECRQPRYEINHTNAFGRMDPWMATLVVEANGITIHYKNRKGHHGTWSAPFVRFSNGLRVYSETHLEKVESSLADIMNGTEDPRSNYPYRNVTRTVFVEQALAEGKPGKFHNGDEFECERAKK